MVTDPKTASYATSSADAQPPPYAENEPPPHDAPGYSAAGSSSSSQTYPFFPAPNIHPSNHLLLSEKDSDMTLGGKYLLDVGLPPPPLASTLPIFRQLGDANLRMEVRDGGIEPEIWLAALKEKALPETRARIAMKLRDGQVNVILHAPHPSLPRPCISLSIEHRDGRNAIAIPRSFRGQMTLKKRFGAVVLSSGLQACTDLLISANGLQIYNVGEPNLAPEMADELKFESRDGGITVMFDDEPPVFSAGRR